MCAIVQCSFDGGLITRSIESAHRGVPASVLVIAPDESIASLLGELVAFAGYRPEHDFTDGVGGESIRRSRPDLVLIDARLARPVVDTCVAACDEVRARPVLTTSTGSEAELLDEAHNRGCIPFALPGQPNRLGHIIQGVMKMKARPPAFSDDSVGLLMRPAFCAAIAGMARMRTLVRRGRLTLGATRALCGPMHETLAELRHSRNALRAAIRDYARHLAASNVPEDQMFGIVGKMLRECARVVGGAAAIAPIENEWKSWAREAYRAT